MCFLSLSCHEPSLVLQSPELDPPEVFQYGHGEPLENKDLKPAPRNYGAPGFSFSHPGHLIFPWTSRSFPDRILLCLDTRINEDYFSRSRASASFDACEYVPECGLLLSTGFAMDHWISFSSGPRIPRSTWNFSIACFST